MASSPPRATIQSHVPSHKNVSPSPVPTASNRPSGLNAQQVSGIVAPPRSRGASARSSSKLATFHTRAAPSAPIVASVLSSGPRTHPRTGTPLLGTARCMPTKSRTSAVPSVRTTANSEPEVPKMQRRTVLSSPSKRLVTPSYPSASQVVAARSPAISSVIPSGLMPHDTAPVPTLTSWRTSPVSRSHTRAFPSRSTVAASEASRASPQACTGTPPSSLRSSTNVDTFAGSAHGQRTEPSSTPRSRSIRKPRPDERITAPNSSCRRASASSVKRTLMTDTVDASTPSTSKSARARFNHQAPV